MTREWTSPDGRMRLINGDCMDFMRGRKDGEFDLAVVDPEFGIGIGNSPRLVTDKGLAAKSWDDKPIDPLYFSELYRVSVDQIIWGGNYYALPANKHCVIWDKVQPESLSFGMFDYAWTSFDGANKIFRQSVRIEGNKHHPTEKPIALYRWIFQNYAKAGDRILDTHVGSASSFIAAWEKGFEIVGCELDADYFDDAVARIEKAMQQPSLPFDTPPTIPEWKTKELF